ncbi:MAG: HAD family hydrolase [Verrucomicrobiota bacterium]
MIKFVIFDMDGTLVDSVDQHALAFQDAFAEFGRSIPHSQIRLQIGKGLENLLPEFLSSSEIGEFGEALGKRKGEIFRKRYLHSVKPFPGVKDLFHRIRRDGKRIALASSAEKTELAALKTCAGIDGLVDAETCASSASRTKPEPDIYETVLSQLGHPLLRETVCVGDTPYDIEAAARAGLETIALRSGGFPEITLLGAARIYDDPQDLLQNYDESPVNA